MSRHSEDDERRPIMAPRVGHPPRPPVAAATPATAAAAAAGLDRHRQATSSAVPIVATSLPAAVPEATRGWTSQYAPHFHCSLRPPVDADERDADVDGEEPCKGVSESAGAWTAGWVALAVFALLCPPCGITALTLLGKRAHARSCSWY